MTPLGQHPTSAASSITLTYGPFTTVARPDQLTPETILWFRNGACPLMAWALVHQAAEHGYTWYPAIVGDEHDWGDWWHMGALTEDQMFVDVTGVHDVDAVCHWWEQHRTNRRHPDNATAVHTVTDLFYALIWYDPRQVDVGTRAASLALADQVLLREGLIPAPTTPSDEERP
ncbi:hypothetical protein [Nocardiopsis synnemataformans]|uniref:hypothetical protein n=1 Tax=Nocardiopsis synnemataformans TaxID=61305 RepID=UPI003EB6EF77